MAWRGGVPTIEALRHLGARCAVVELLDLLITIERTLYCTGREEILVLLRTLLNPSDGDPRARNVPSGKLLGAAGGFDGGDVGYLGKRWQFRAVDYLLQACRRLRSKILPRVVRKLTCVQAIKRAPDQRPLMGRTSIEMSVSLCAFIERVAVIDERLQGVPRARRVCWR